MVKSASVGPCVIYKRGAFLFLRLDFFKTSTACSLRKIAVSHLAIKVSSISILYFPILKSPNIIDTISIANMQFSLLLLCATAAVASVLVPNNDAQLNGVLEERCTGCIAVNETECYCANPCDCGGADAGNTACCGVSAISDTE